MDEVTKRIAELLESTGLSNKEFSEKIGVSPAIISHVLSGRNKPSLTVIQNILNTYTRVNSRYLLAGHGSLFAESASKGNTKESGNTKADTNSAKPSQENKETKREQSPTTATGSDTPEPESTPPPSYHQGTFPGMANDGVRYVNPPDSTPLPIPSETKGEEEPQSPPLREESPEKASRENSFAQQKPAAEKQVSTKQPPAPTESQKDAKQVVRIVFFYQDHSFEEYRP